MPTTRLLQPQVRTVQGMDSTTPPHLVADTKWVMSRGLRSYYGKIIQFPNFVNTGVINVSAPVVDGLWTLPTGTRADSLQVTLATAGGNQGVYQLRNTPSASVRLPKKDGTFTVLRGDPGDLQAYNLFAGTVYNNQLWFLDPTTKLRYTDGTCVNEYTTPVPSARYITTFFDHLFVLNGTYKGMYEPWTLRWSDLYNPGLWEPSPENEADLFDLSAWQRTSGIVAGGTGLGRINDRLYAYTEGCIFRVTYTGLPKVVYVEPAWEDYGNFFLYGLVATRDVHFFFDVSHQNFYMFDGQSRPEAIGDDILGFFLANVNLSFSSTDRTQELVGFALPERNEAWWSFYATTLSAWVAIVYNWKAQAWTILRTPGRIKTVGGGGTRAKTVDELTGTADGLTGTADSLSLTDVKMPRQFITEIVSGTAGTFYREQLPADGATTLQEAPFLESKDFTTPDLQREAEVDRIAIHSDYNLGTGATDGINVYVSARQALHEAVVFKKVGLWTKTTPQGIISFPPIRGRIFRYKFELTGATVLLGSPRDWTFFSYTDNVFNIQAEQ